ncbi:hypothetical protein ACA910_018893 [Epithemia clementina (nom. ined.)]
MVFGLPQQPDLSTRSRCLRQLLLLAVALLLLKTIHGFDLQNANSNRHRRNCRSWAWEQRWEKEPATWLSLFGRNHEPRRNIATDTKKENSFQQHLRTTTTTTTTSLLCSRSHQVLSSRGGGDGGIRARRRGAIWSAASTAATTAEDDYNNDRSRLDRTVLRAPPPAVWWLWQWLPISSSLIIGVFSVLEILEGFRELAERSSRMMVGHAHGIFVLALIRLGRSLAFVRFCRSVAILQTEVEEVGEGLEKLGWEEQQALLHHDHDHDHPHIGGNGGGGGGLLARVGRCLVSPAVSIVACVVAGVACAVEIWDDMKPGAHHGAALLALSELVYQMRRLRGVYQIRRRRRAAAAAAAETSNNPQHHHPKQVLQQSSSTTTRWSALCFVLDKIPVGMMVCIVAAVYALMEFVEDMQPGAHHGVAVLALAEMVENINRSQVVVLRRNPNKPAAAVA